MKKTKKLILYNVYDQKSCIFSSELISDYIGIKIHKDYDIKDNTIFQNYLCKLYKDKEFDIINNLANEYKLKYSKLSLIKNNDYRTNFDLLMGVNSKFNEHDIKFFCNVWENSIKTKYWNIIGIFEEYFNISFGYVSSPFTLNYINDHFNIVNKEYLNNEINKLFL